MMNFTNDMGNMPATNCGLAAVASLWSFYGHSVRGNLKHLERKYPPDLGPFGSSQHHLERVLRQHGINAKRRKLNLKTLAERPAIMMMQVDRRGKLPMAHYCVAYELDNGWIKMTNWDDEWISVPKFEQLNSGLLPSLVRMRGMGIVRLGKP